MKRCVILIVAAYLLSSACWAAAPVPTTLNADQVEYDQKSGLATAEGNAVLMCSGMKLRASRIRMNTKTQLVEAWSDSVGEPIVFSSGPQIVRGKYAVYQLDEKKGQLIEATGQMPAGLGTAYLKSSEAELAPVQDALSQGWFKSRYAQETTQDDVAVKMHDVIVTTCKQVHPHYHLRTRQMVIVPGRWVIAKSPRVYLKGHLVFIYPFDLVISGTGGRRKPFAPSLTYDSNRQFGIVSKGAFFWTGGQLSIDMYLWSHVGFEGKVRVDQSITPWLSAYAEDSYQWNKELDQKKLRPRWGFLLGHSGWNAELYWAERQTLSVYRRPGEEAYETTLWRKPEFKVSSPWVGLYIGNWGQYCQFDGVWGRYQEAGLYRDPAWRTRWGWGGRYFTDYVFSLGREWTVTPFVDASYHQYHYDVTGSPTQDVTTAKVGVLLRHRGFSLGLAYLRQRVSGRSPFSWGRFSDADQLYPRIGFDVTSHWHLDVQGLVDLRDSRASDGHWHRELKSVDYQLIYNNHCCSRWWFFVHDDLTDKDDDKYGIAFEVTAFPESRQALGLAGISNAFSRPGVPARKQASSTKHVLPPTLETEKTSEEDGVYVGLSSGEKGTDATKEKTAK